MANTIPTLMCISPDLDWHGRAGVQPVYCAATLAVLCKSDTAVERQGDGTLKLRVCGVDMVATRAPAPSRWWTLAAVEAAS